jgi:hypothetical protein
MIEYFQISIWRQFKSFQKGLIIFLFAFIAFIIGGIVGFFDLNNSLFLKFVLVCFVFSLPAFYVHLTYLINNWNTILIVNQDQNEFTIKTNAKYFTYKYENIQETELNLGIYYKNQIDNRGRKIAPWTNYGYLKLKLNDGNVFIFTSLMIDLEKMPFPISITRFRLFPIISSS